ncbi:MAG: hypothetical protein Q9164_001280 [Protoblastenia rupestris]
MNFTAPDGLQVVMMEQFETMTSAVDCKGDDGTMSVTFKSQSTYDYATERWSYINENDDDKFILITNHDGCGPQYERQPYFISRVDEDETSLTISFTAELIPWSRILKTWTCDLSKLDDQPQKRHERRSLRRIDNQSQHFHQRRFLGKIGKFIGGVVDTVGDVVGDVANVVGDVVNVAGDVIEGVGNFIQGDINLEKSVSFTVGAGQQGQRTNIFTDSSGRLKLDCVNCYVGGSVKVTGRIEVDNWDLEDFSITAQPEGFAAALELEAIITASDAPQSIQHTKELFSAPVPGAGIQIPGIFKFGAILSYEVGVSASFQGSATIGFGLKSTIPDGAKIVLDIDDQSDSGATGFDAAVQPIFDVKQLSASVTVSAFSQPKLSFGVELFKVANADVGLAMKLPEISATLAAGKEEAGFCSQDAGASKTGVKLSSDVKVELNAQADVSFLSGKSNKPDWSKKIFEWSQPLLSTCFPLDIGLGAVPGTPNVPTLPPADPATLPPTDPAAIPATDPAAVPALDPAAVPVTDPAAVPATDPAAVPALDPAAVPATDPAAVPATDPAAIPATDPAAVPALDPAAVPATDPAAVPATDPAAIPVTDPAAVPALDPAAVPATDPAAVPALDPAAVPATDPAAIPATDPAAVPATDPATLPATDPLANPAAVPGLDPAALPPADPAVVSTTPQVPSEDPTIPKPGPGVPEVVPIPLAIALPIVSANNSFYLPSGILPAGTGKLPVGTGRPLIVTDKYVVGTGKYPVGTGKPSVGISKYPIGTGRSSIVGTGRPPLGTGQLSAGTGKYPISTGQPSAVGTGKFPLGTGTPVFEGKNKLPIGTGKIPVMSGMRGATDEPKGPRYPLRTGSSFGTRYPTALPQSDPPYPTTSSIPGMRPEQVPSNSTRVGTSDLKVQPSSSNTGLDSPVDEGKDDDVGSEGGGKGDSEEKSKGNTGGNSQNGQNGSSDGGSSGNNGASQGGTGSKNEDDSKPDTNKNGNNGSDNNISDSSKDQPPKDQKPKTSEKPNPPDNSRPIGRPKPPGRNKPSKSPEASLQPEAPPFPMASNGISISPSGTQPYWSGPTASFRRVVRAR